MLSSRPRPRVRARRTALTTVSTVLATALAVPLLPAPVSAAARSLDAACPEGTVRSSGFLDVAGSAHERGIACLVHWGVASGTTVTRYAPSGTVSRGQVASFLFRALTADGAALPGSPPDAFTDDDGSVHEAAIDALTEAGVVTGRAPGRYEPEAPVSRAQLAALVVRAYDLRAEQAGQSGLPAGPDAFPDDEGSALETDIDKAAAAGLVAGYADGTYRPSSAVTREAMASFLARWLDLAVSRGLGSVPARPAAVRVVAAGDLACQPGKEVTRATCQHAATADLAERLDPEAVLVPGDIQYASGTVEEFTTPGGYEGTWSRLLDRTWPVAGNHEWETPGAAGYRHVFDGRTGGRFWYSFDLDGWHVVALDSNCSSIGGCSEGSPQHDWLLTDLAAHDGKPTVVFWHRPKWTTGESGESSSMDDTWGTVATDRDVQLVLGGHDHDYERFDRLDAEGAVTSTGLPSMVVGTGGKSLYCDRTDAHPGSRVFDCSTHGVLVLLLKPDGIAYEFVPAVGSFTDSGTLGLRPRA